MSRKLLYLLVVGQICWGTVGVVATNVSNAHAAARFMPLSPVVISLREPVSTTLPQTPAGRLFSLSSSYVIALTFDDGPNPVFTPQVLQVLKQYAVRATFFCIGQQVQRYPGLLQQTYQAGNTIGNHTWSHANLTKLSPDGIRRQLRTTSIAIQDAIGIPPVLFRPPDGATNKEVRSIASELGLRQILWTIDTRDWQRPGVGAIVSTVLTNARNGSIVLMHDGGGNRSQTVQALPQIIIQLRQRGFTFVSL
jgi:peptidoglycan-N-acetylglucosamine deacetylase